MEQLELLLIVVAHKFMQLKTHNQRRKHFWWVHDIIKNRLQQGAYHNLVKDLQFDEEISQQYFRLTREQFDQVLCYIEEDFAFWHSCLSERKHPTLTSSRISQLPPSDTLLPHESLHGPIQFAAYAAIRSRTTNRMPYPDIWNHPRPFTCFSIFAV